MSGLVFRIFSARSRSQSLLCFDSFPGSFFHLNNGNASAGVGRGRVDRARVRPYASDRDDKTAVTVQSRKREVGVAAVASRIACKLDPLPEINTVIRQGRVVVVVMVAVL